MIFCSIAPILDQSSVEASDFNDLESEDRVFLEDPNLAPARKPRHPWNRARKCRAVSDIVIPRSADRIGLRALKLAVEHEDAGIVRM